MGEKQKAGSSVLLPPADLPVVKYLLDAILSRKVPSCLPILLKQITTKDLLFCVLMFARTETPGSIQEAGMEFQAGGDVFSKRPVRGATENSQEKRVVRRIDF